MKRFAILLALALSFLLVQAAAAELVLNGDFESGDFSNWTLSGNIVDFVGVGASGVVPVHSGNFAAFFGPIGSEGHISQNIATTPGASYQLSFWLDSNGFAPNHATVVWDGNTIFNPVDFTSQVYTAFSATVTATANLTTLDFGFQDDPGFLYVDDISVNPVPIPGTVVLLGSGLLPLLGWRRFRKS